MPSRQSINLFSAGACNCGALLGIGAGGDLLGRFFARRLRFGDRKEGDRKESQCGVNERASPLPSLLAGLMDGRCHHVIFRSHARVGPFYILFDFLGALDIEPPGHQIEIAQEVPANRVASTIAVVAPTGLDRGWDEK